jgi:hypothetical protein
MNRNLAVALAGVALLVVACAPTTEATMITPDELVIDAPATEVFALVTSAIGTMPYPSDTSGWVILQSDQAGGFISAQISQMRCPPGQICLFGGELEYIERVSVAMNGRDDGTTAVNISLTRGELADALANRIRGRLVELNN